MEEITKPHKSDIERQQDIRETNLAWKKRFDELQVFSFSEAYPAEDNPHIRALVKVRPSATRTLLFTVIADICRSFNIQNTMSSQQIVECVQDIIYDFPNLTMKDFKLFSSMATKGSFGKTFNRIDKQVFYEWLNLYCDAQFKHVENEHTNNRHFFTDFSQFDPRVREVFLKATESAESAKQHEKQPIIRQQTEGEKMIQEWIREFDSIYREQIKSMNKVPPLRMINLGSDKKPNWVDCTQYVEIKLMEATS